MAISADQFSDNWDRVFGTSGKKQGDDAENAENIVNLVQRYTDDATEAQRKYFEEWKKRS